MISVLYASISTFIIVWLSINVIKKRRTYRVSVGDGDVDELKTAMAAQSNAIEYIPIYLILLLSLESNNANILLVHVFGVLLITGRIIHAKGMLSATLRTRVKGMQITIYSLLLLALTNLVYLPYDKLLKI